MKGDRIYYYKRGGIYVLNRAFHKGSNLIYPFYSCHVGIYPDADIETEFVCLDKDGLMTIEHAYACDGPSWPAIATSSTIRTAFIHDGTFQLLRLGKLSMEWFGKANDNLRDFGIEDGMWKWRANLWHSDVVQKGMRSSATNNKCEKELCAP